MAIVVEMKKEGVDLETQEGKVFDVDMEWS